MRLILRGEYNNNDVNDMCDGKRSMFSGTIILIRKRGFSIPPTSSSFS